MQGNRTGPRSFIGRSPRFPPLPQDETRPGEAGGKYPERILSPKRLAKTGGRQGLARFVKGDVVVVPFPFSNLSSSKRRPALVVAELEGDDLILCQITSQQIRDRYAIPIDETDFQKGGLKQRSNVRPNRLFTADRQGGLYQVRPLNPHKIPDVI